LCPYLRAYNGIVVHVLSSDMNRWIAGATDKIYIHALAHRILVLRSTVLRGRRADACGASGLRTLFRLHFTLSFTNFHVFYFLPLIFFYPKILCQNISPSFLSQNLLMDFFWLLNFCLQKNFAPQLFFPKFIDLKIF